MTHDELVHRAAMWLKHTIGCGVVLSEHAAGREYPDAIGWRYTWSYVVECKVSRSDFFADRKKASRACYEMRPGAWCYYMTPPKLVASHELPDGWGLLEISDAARRNVRVVVKPKPEEHICDRTREQLRDDIGRLYQEVRRYQAQGLKYKTFAELHARGEPATLLDAVDPVDGTGTEGPRA